MCQIEPGDIPTVQERIVDPLHNSLDIPLIRKHDVLLLTVSQRVKLLIAQGQEGGIGILPVGR